MGAISGQHKNANRSQKDSPLPGHQRKLTDHSDQAGQVRYPYGPVAISGARGWRLDFFFVAVFVIP
jgi:hypothetical protein